MSATFMVKSTLTGTIATEIATVLRDTTIVKSALGTKIAILANRDVRAIRVKGEVASRHVIVEVVRERSIGVATIACMATIVIKEDVASRLAIVGVVKESAIRVATFARRSKLHGAQTREATNSCS